MERFDRRRAGLLAQEQLQRGPLAPQARQHPGQQERGDGGDHAHPHFARKRLAGALDQVGQLLRLAQQMRWALATTALPSGVKRTARLVRSTSVTPSSVSRSRSPADKRRLRDEAGIRRAAEMPMFVQGDQVLQLLERGQVGGHRRRLSHGGGWFAKICFTWSRKGASDCRRANEKRLGLTNSTFTL
jgi:hypothetical protein